MKLLLFLNTQSEKDSGEHCGLWLRAQALKLDC